MDHRSKWIGAGSGDRKCAWRKAATPGWQNYRQCSYAFVFLYDSESFDGLDIKIFRQALADELGISFETTYTPLDHSEVYYPHTKKRHHLSDSYQKAIHPSRWNYP